MKRRTFFGSAFATMMTPFMTLGSETPKRFHRFEKWPKLFIENPPRLTAEEKAELVDAIRKQHMGPIRLESKVVEFKSIAGAPEDMDFLTPLTPVGVEWDESVRPIDQLSYAGPGRWVPIEFESIRAGDHIWIDDPSVKPATACETNGMVVLASSDAKGGSFNVSHRMDYAKNEWVPYAKAAR